MKVDEPVDGVPDGHMHDAVADPLDHAGKLVRRDVRVQRADDRDVVDALADVRKKIAHFDAGLSFFLKLELRRQWQAADEAHP